MKAEETAGGTLVVSYTSAVFARLFLVLLTVFLATAIYDMTLGPRGTDRMVGLLGAAATCLLSGVVLLETTRFEFARSTRTLFWRRRWGLRVRSGSLRFSDIRSVSLQRPMGDDGTPSRRIVITTTSGVQVPVTMGYEADPDEAVVQVADLIRAVVGLRQDGTPAEEIETLIAEGRTIDAIKRLRETGSSLTDAKRRVDERKGRS
jgi:hypothetical protein